MPWRPGSTASRGSSTSRARRRPGRASSRHRSAGGMMPGPMSVIAASLGLVFWAIRALPALRRAGESYRLPLIHSARVLAALAMADAALRGLGQWRDPADGHPGVRVDGSAGDPQRVRDASGLGLVAGDRGDARGLDRRVPGDCRADVGLDRGLWVDDRPLRDGRAGRLGAGPATIVGGREGDARSDRLGGAYRGRGRLGTGDVGDRVELVDRLAGGGDGDGRGRGGGLG